MRGMVCLPIFFLNFVFFCSILCVSQLSQCLPTIFHSSFSVNSFAAHFVFFLPSLSPPYLVIPGKSHLSVLSLLTPFNAFLRLFLLFFHPLCRLSPLSLLILPEFKHHDSGGQQTSLGTEEILHLVGID